jgi:hypothetical protein
LGSASGRKTSAGGERLCILLNFSQSQKRAAIDPGDRHDRLAVSEDLQNLLKCLR